MANEQDMLLPINNVGRIMRQIVPPSAKISKEAKQSMQECATEFISFVTSEASDKCHKENRKTVNGDDICWALSSLGFDDFAQAIVRYLHKYREGEAERERANQAKASNSQDQLEVEASNHQVLKLKQQMGAPTPFEFGILEKGSSSSSLLKPS